MRRPGVLPIVLLAGVASVSGQTPAPAQKAAAPKATAAAPAAAPARVTPGQAAPVPAAPAASAPAAALPVTGGFSYDAGGRRDPFVSLVRRGADPQRSAPAVRASGLAGLETAEITLKGTVASRGGYVAIVQGTDNKTYIVREGERLADGTVRTITQSAMVIVQQVKDALSLDKQREVRKMLRQNEEAK